LFPPIFRHLREAAVSPDSPASRKDAIGSTSAAPDERRLYREFPAVQIRLTNVSGAPRPTPLPPAARHF
jgi:hypothetical protein